MEKFVASEFVTVDGAFEDTVGGGEPGFAMSAGCVG
jgi:hypothetical protein